MTLVLYSSTLPFSKKDTSEKRGSSFMKMALISYASTLNISFPFIDFEHLISEISYRNDHIEAVYFHPLIRHNLLLYNTSYTPQIQILTSRKGRSPR